jgi:hypothetical protein
VRLASWRGGRPAQCACARALRLCCSVLQRALRHACAVNSRSLAAPYEQREHSSAAFLQWAHRRGPACRRLMAVRMQLVYEWQLDLKAVAREGLWMQQTCEAEGCNLPDGSAFKRLNDTVIEDRFAQLPEVSAGVGSGERHPSGGIPVPHCGISPTVLGSRCHAAGSSPWFRDPGATLRDPPHGSGIPLSLGRDDELSCSHTRVRAPASNRRAASASVEREGRVSWRRTREPRQLGLNRSAASAGFELVGLI